jgi:hypothetical protein
MVRLGDLESPGKKRKRDYASEQLEGVMADASLLPLQLATVRESLNVIAQHLPTLFAGPRLRCNGLLSSSC